jgi:hypothetical protein
MPLALVTGASSGIGREFARQLSAKGYDLILVARQRDRLEALARELAAEHGIRAEALAADLASHEGLQEVEARIETSPSPDLLVNNAGFGTLGAFHAADVSGQDRMHRLHVLATVRLTHAALKVMVARGAGGIINVSSVAGFMAAPGNVSYCATKHWMNVFTEGLYMELKNAHSPVKVQALCPGFTYTEFHDRMEFDRSAIPERFWLKADFVVAESLRGLHRGTLFVIPGWRYKILVAVVGFLPRRFARYLSVRSQRNFKRL